MVMEIPQNFARLQPSPKVPHALVIMTNGDVYYITLKERNRFLEETITIKPFQRFKTKDAKSGASLDIFVKHISSMVVGANQNG